MARQLLLLLLRGGPLAALLAVGAGAAVHTVEPVSTPTRCAGCIHGQELSENLLAASAPGATVTCLKAAKVAESAEQAHAWEGT